jgi:uncharacterized membrane protein
MVEVPLDAEVECTDGSCGESVTVIVNPTTREITHIVVQDKTFPRGVERLVPVEQVAESSSGKIRLNCTRDELEQMEEFVEMEFIRSEVSPGQPVAPSYDLPYVIPVGAVAIPVEVERIPPGELAVRRGTTVEATDGHIGKVGELVVEEESGHVTHLVLQEGHLWDKKQIILPLSAIDVVQEGTVYLKLDKKAVEQLPAMHVARRYKRGDGQVEFFARVFDDQAKAEEGLEFVRDLHRRKSLKILNSAILVKDAVGETFLEETGDLDAGQGRLFGAITGGLVGLLAGPVGAVVGALTGAGAGGLAAKWMDMGFSDTFLEGLSEHLEPGRAAVLVLVEHEWVQPLSEAFADMKGVAIQQTLTDRLVEQLLAESESQA